ncbi:hypothetical protein V8C34DRAFT_319237 [Trichoderma compactum]
MSSSRTQPIFEPISRHLTDPIRPIRGDLEIIQPEEFDPRVPYGWGFFIYRAGLNRLEKWLRREVKNSRYTSGDEADRWKEHPDYMPAPGEPDVTDEVAARMWNEVVEKYPDAQEIITEPEGSEDFSPIGRDFAARVEAFDMDTSTQDEKDRRRNTRYENCLIIDGRVLEMLEGLPEDTLPGQAEQILRDNWVIMVFFFFLSASGYVTKDWQSLAEEDKDNWDTVRWWKTIARTCNKVRQASRAASSNAMASS